jgi:thiamine-monophosphate kinase
MSDEIERLEIVRRVFSTSPAEGISFDLPGVSLIADASSADDAAVYRIEGIGDLVATSDYVRGPKFALFERGYLTLHDLGYYLAVANLSDVAAMGAAPLGLLTVIRYPEEMNDHGFEEVLQGIADACRKHGTVCVGGDIGGAERLILSGTALGIAPLGRAILRSSGQPDDLLCVTGPVGTAGAAVIYFTRVKADGQRLADQDEKTLLDAWRRPRARFDVTRTLAHLGLATACQDISDGLRATVEQLSTASNCGAEVTLEKVPIDPVIAKVALAVGVDPYALAVSASVDFELLLAVAPTNWTEAVAAAAMAGFRLHVIGRLRKESGVVAIIDGAPQPMPGVRWRHQPGDVASTVVEGLKSSLRGDA